MNIKNKLDIELYIAPPVSTQHPIRAPAAPVEVGSLSRFPSSGFS